MLCTLPSVVCSVNDLGANICSVFDIGSVVCSVGSLCTVLGSLGGICDSALAIVHKYPALLIFLTVGIGFYVGKIKIGSFSLGSVAAVLLTGVIIGQVGASVSGPIKTFFFMMFLFSIGYKVGPDFFKSLKGEGLKQMLFAIIMGSISFGVVVLAGLLFGFGPGETVGMYSGSQTCSAVMGLGIEGLTKLGLTPDEVSNQQSLVAVCYAVTYIVGTLGGVIILGNLGPRLLGGIPKVKKAADKYAEQLSGKPKNNDPAIVSAEIPIIYRSYLAKTSLFDEPITVESLEKKLAAINLPVHVEKVMHDGNITVPGDDYKIVKDDTIVLVGRREYIKDIAAAVGPETADTELLQYPIEKLTIVVAKKDAVGHPLSDIYTHEYMRGISVAEATRDGKPLAVTPSLVLQKGDRLLVLGRSSSIDNALPHLGYEDRPSFTSDLMFIGLAVFIGGFFGALNLHFGTISVGLGTSAGALISGLVFGWMRSRRPTFGNISPGALWFMNNLGLSVFIAIVGLEAAPKFLPALQTVGPMLLVASIFTTIIPLFAGLWIGNKLFRFNPAITLGCCTGARTSTPSLGAVQVTIDSTVPTIGYTVGYATTNLMVILWVQIVMMIFG